MGKFDRFCDVMALMLAIIGIVFACANCFDIGTFFVVMAILVNMP